MAIDPPYRLDPFRNIINIHWEEETSTSTGGRRPRKVISWNLMGSSWSAGYYNNNIYDIYQGCDYPGPHWTINGISVYSNIANYHLTNPQNWATAWVSAVGGGLYFAGNWESHGGAGGLTVLENIGTYGIDFSGVTATYDDGSGTPAIYHAVDLIDVRPAYWTLGPAYSGWLVGELILEADD